MFKSSKKIKIYVLFIESWLNLIKCLLFMFIVSKFWEVMLGLMLLIISNFKNVFMFFYLFYEVSVYFWFI